MNRPAVCVYVHHAKLQGISETRDGAPIVKFHDQLSPSELTLFFDSEMDMARAAVAMMNACAEVFSVHVVAEAEQDFAYYEVHADTMSELSADLILD